MTLKTSLIITGDTSVAQRAVDDLAKAVDKSAASSRTAAAAAEQLGAAESQAATGAREQAAAVQAADTAIGEMAASSRQLATVQGAVGTSTANAARGIKQHTQATNDNTDAARRNAFGLRNLGQQFGDFAVQVQGGAGVARAFSAQAGQMGYALSEMSGKLGAVGRFLTGPWGIALTIALTTLAPFVEKLFEGGDASDQLKDKTLALEDALGKQAFATEAAKKALDDYNQAQDDARKHDSLTVDIALRLADARLKEARATVEATKALIARALAQYQVDKIRAQAPGQRGELGALAADVSSTRVGALQNLLGQQETAAGTLEQAQRNLYIQHAKTAAAEAADPIRKLNDEYDRMRDRAIRAAAGNTALAKSLDTTLSAIERRRKADVDAQRERGRDERTQPRKTASSRADTATPREAEEIQRINEAWDAQPSLVDRAAQATRRLDAIIADLTKRHPPGFEKLIADAQQAKGVIQQGLNKPFDDLIAQQREQLQIGALINQGRVVEADTLRTILSFERDRVPLTDQQKASILASTAALAAQEQQLERIRQKQQVNLNALQDMASIIKQSIYEGPQSLANLPGRLLDAFKRYKADAIFDKYFGDIFQQLKNQVTGADQVEKASTQVASSFGSVSSAAGSLATALKAAAQSATPAAPVAGIAAIGSPAGGAIGGITQLPDAGDLSELIAEALGSDIVVNGVRKKAQPDQRQPKDDIWAEGFTRIAKGVGISDDAAGKIGHTVSKGLSGAFEGQAAAGVASLLGIKTNSTTAAIGGAVGSLLGPAGSIVGGLLGGIVGGLFAPKARPGGASIGIGANGEAAVTGNVGSDKQGIAAGNSLGGQVASSINDIVGQLGATLGNFSVQIGTYKDRYRVNVNGRPLGGVTGSGATDFGDDQNAAINYAIQQAIAQGAVQGVSDAVAKALKSSPDVDAALKEALKVQDVELAIGGIGAQISKAFKDFEATAKDRVRIAQQYGLDVVAVEKKNAEDRVALESKLLQQQVGSLQSLVDDIKGGSLFEGSAVDKIKAINDQITKAQADLAAGVDGAADTLANLYQQQLAATKDAYGTTSGYADARNAILDAATKAIADANARITQAEAQYGSDPALATTNAALDENNDQNAQIIALNAQLLAALNQNNALLAQVARSGINVARLNQLAGV